MNQNDLMEANNKMKKLIGVQGISFGRVAAMAWINFGADDSEYALHLQCSFRIRDKDEILVTNTDMFEPSESALKKPMFDYDTFEWDEQGENRYDEWVKKLNPAYLRSLKVTDAKVNVCGDVTILLEQEIVIDVFVNATVEECWRLFKIGSDQHFVMTGDGIEE